MFWFVMAIIFAVVALVCAVMHWRMPKTVPEFVRERGDGYFSDTRLKATGKETPSSSRRIVGTVALAALALTVICAFFSTFYTQTVGEVKVQRAITGRLLGQTNSDGWHWKAPGSSVITFDVRNIQVEFFGDGSDNFPRGNNGGQLDFNDANDQSGNIGIVVMYSIIPDRVTTGAEGEMRDGIYQQYSSQEAFDSQVIQQQVRAAVTTVLGRFTTHEILTDRDKVRVAIVEYLVGKWGQYGVEIDEVSLRKVIYPEELMNSITAKSSSLQDVETAKNRQTQAEVEAETARIQAEGAANAAIEQARGEAEANRLIAQSLTPEILQNRWIEAIRQSGNTIVVPEGSTPFVQTPGG
jgi:regulator of protease activity HflC (stomatin/prohibitin superfamily)